jgi:hypothetical protein
LTLQAADVEGSGIGVVHGEATARLGVAKDGVPKFLVTDKVGASLLRVPEAK